MKKLVFIIGLFLITLPNFAQVAYECTVTQTVSSPNLHISYFIRSTGSTPFILGSANFRLNVNTNGLNITSVPAEIAEGLWDNGNDPDNYADQFNGRNATDGWVSINIESLFTGDGVQVPTNATLIGTMSIPISNVAENSGVNWRTVGLNRTEVLDHDGNDITVLGTFVNPPVQPLPVELTSFTSKLMNDKVQLNWSTKTELNNFGFDIERSTDGISFSKIGFVEGHGNSNSEKNYSFTDAPKSSSKYSYRLKQLDTDGKYEYSKIVEVDYQVKPTEYALSQNYPNPFNPSTVIKYQLPKDNFVSLKVYNAIGQEVANLVNEVKPTGVYEVNFDASNLSSGIYYYILRIGSGSTNEFTRTNKMILLK